MVYAVICGVLLGIFLLNVRSSPRMALHAQRGSRSLLSRQILKDICRDLTYMFHFQKPGQFIGPLEGLNNPNILKNLVMVEDKESCTINKSTIHLCTKDPRNGQEYDKNTLMFVVLHELAHVLCEDIGHSEKFLTINTSLLNYAIQKGLYDPSKPFVKNYCNLK
jgi:hypothetical protein